MSKTTQTPSLPMASMRKAQQHNASQRNAPQRNAAQRGFRNKVKAGAFAFALCSFAIVGCQNSSDMATTPDQSTTANTEALKAAIQSKDTPMTEWNDNKISQDRKNKIENAKAVQMRHHGEFMTKKDVMGTGVGFEADGTPNVTVFTRKSVSGLAASVEGHKVRQVVIGDVKADAVYTGTYRPVPEGVSIGNDLENAAGTLGCEVQKNGIRYILSNNHVLARQNAASIGERIDQPGRYETGGYQTGQVAVLSQYKPIDFVNPNSFDAAIAQVTVPYTLSMVNNLYSPNAYYYMNPYVGLAVKKVGRTTGLTYGTIGAINVTITVGYNGGTATFTNQIYVPGQFIQPGDSGSLMVSQNGNYPFGLCFAGSSTASFANPIYPVLQYFGVTLAR